MTNVINFSFFCRRLFPVFVLLAVACGVFFRLWRLKESGFFFYDEGFYLKHNLSILEFVSNHPGMSSQDKHLAAYYYFRSALGSGKSLWFLVMDSRFLWGALYDWTFAKSAACFFGILSIPLVFLFSRRYFNSNAVAFLSAGLFALLPGAVFYSRIGLQEAFSTFLVLGGFYLYFFPRKMSWHSFAAGIVFALAFFSNYRLIMLPILIGFYELWLNYVTHEGLGWRKYVWTMLSFFSCVVIGGNLLGGVNTQIIAMWVFHQGQGAGGAFSWINLISYPYYLFRLETFLFALFFFGNIYFLIRQKWAAATLFVVAAFQMLFFSFTEEKGARYIAVMFPFMAMSVAFLFYEMWRSFEEGRRYVLAGVVAVMMGLMGVQSFSIMMAGSGHKNVVEYLLIKDPAVKIMASQEMVEGLYVYPHDRVKAVPVSFEKFLALYSKGYRYLVLDPQSYVSLTDKRKFVLPLKDYLGYIDAQVDPQWVFPHMNKVVGERFVFEHSENLLDSVRFLDSADINRFLSLRVYDLTVLIPDMVRIHDRLKGRH